MNKQALKQSFIKVLDQIEKTGSVWVKLPNRKWFKTFDKETVTYRKDEIKQTIIHLGHQVQ